MKILVANQELMRSGLQTILGERPARDHAARRAKGRPLTRAVVLAAGLGSRLGSSDVPKPLARVAGVPLVVTVLETLASQGVEEAIVVVGHLGDHIRRELGARRGELGLEAVFVENPAFTRSNGLSLLAAAPWVDHECLLTMADHLVSPRLIAELQRFEAPRGESALAIDRDISACFDLDDATKVQTRGAWITDLGKSLETYDALDTGVFRIQPELLTELDRLARDSGDCSLSDGVRALARRGRFLACDVTGMSWIDVDTPAAAAHAEAMGTL